MTPTTLPFSARESEARTLALEFAAKWPTPNVRQAVAYCESGRLEWSAVAELFARSFASAQASL